MGRPKKLKDNRTRYTMYLDDEIRKAIDEYVYLEKQTKPDYSRSDFLNEASAAYLKQKNALNNESNHRTAQDAQYGEK